MSREINLTEKLSPEDHEYFRGRWDTASLRRNAMELGVPQGDSDRAAFWSYDEYEARVADAEQKAAEPQDGPEADPNAGTGSTPTPASIGAQQATGTGLAQTGTPDDGPTPWKQGPRAFADSELDGKPYEDWKVEQLKAEVAKRNELRDGNEEYADDEPMSTDGLKADLVTRLTEDDEADAPE